MSTKMMSTLPPILTITLLLPWSISVARMVDYELLAATEVVDERSTYEGNYMLTILMMEVDIYVRFCSDIVKFVIYVYTVFAFVIVKLETPSDTVTSVLPLIISYPLTLSTTISMLFVWVDT